ncbi:MAG: hypothetical protein P1U87_17965 [Verrucomicrobiales bacterium]|nr:hypothetical protein [Verrucomicrobiales bacterium]
MEAVSDESSFSRNSREQDEGRYRSGNLILWIAAIAVLIGLNFASWSFCMWVFGQPEHPMNYRLLTKLDKMDPIRGFLPFTAPRGKFYSAKDLYANVFPYNPTELRAYNGILKRHYLKNYLERDDVVFLSGEFAVESVQEMGADDVFTSGIVIRGRSTTFPDVILDFALPSESPPETFGLKNGDIIQVPESSTCAALLHVDRRKDSVMVFTVVPLVTRTPGVNGGPIRMEKEFELAENAKVVISTPSSIQIDPERWPISTPEDSLIEIEEKPVDLAPAEEEETEAAPE